MINYFNHIYALSSSYQNLCINNPRLNNTKKHPATVKLQGVLESSAKYIKTYISH